MADGTAVQILFKYLLLVMFVFVFFLFLIFGLRFHLSIKSSDQRTVSKNLMKTDLHNFADVKINLALTIFTYS